ncbi:barstar family protein [Dickeya zeae]|uniref:barstar family protein n=1 Tax=Dickeya zeae TaxID=204042 RepID=UPI000D814343|nr:barstar family protein [Dickeya zeae]PXW48289.1 ribonuclease inhibitor [Erwinia sp. AG740]
MSLSLTIKNKMEVSEREIILDGLNIYAESDVHGVLSEKLDFGPYYGRNLNALWDRLSNDVERPVTLVWMNSDTTRQRLGDTFNRIVEVLERVRKQDIELNFDDKFDYILK